MFTTLNVKQILVPLVLWNEQEAVNQKIYAFISFLKSKGCQKNDIHTLKACLIVDKLIFEASSIFFFLFV